MYQCIPTLLGTEFLLTISCYTQFLCLQISLAMQMPTPHRAPLAAYCSLLFLLLPSLLFSQRLNKYWVEFSDKNNSPYCTCRPAEFLSARALQRRALAGIAILENDLPVNPNYLNVLKNNGVQLHTTSRWLNAAAVISDTSAIKNLRKLAFVKNVTYIGPHLRYRNPPNRPTKKRQPLAEMPTVPGASRWGYAALQNNLLGVPLLHMAGHRGEGKWVAVMDGGFTNTDTIPLFDSVALQHRLYAAHDFVEHDGALYESAQHGTSVLSVMAANLPGYFVGTAPDATYFLLKTEDTGGEFPVEETNWIAGAEWADSAGVDIINASLGYTQFNDTTLGHRYWELNGRTAIGSRGAAIAATKGMIICNSAGNEGDGPWRHLGVPADAPGVIAVGAVSFDEKRAAFSSLGPTADGRIKPDLMAPGDEVVTAGNVGIKLGGSSGTSLASPMLAGALASLWSAFPDRTAREILEAVYAVADQSAVPDNERGYGLPNMTLAWLRLGGYDPQGRAFEPVGGTLSLLLSASDDLPLDGTFEVRDVWGKKVANARAELRTRDISELKISGLGSIPAGNYTVVFIGKERVERVLWRR